HADPNKDITAIMTDGKQQSKVYIVKETDRNRRENKQRTGCIRRRNKTFRFDLRYLFFLSEPCRYLGSCRIAARHAHCPGKAPDTGDIENRTHHRLEHVADELYNPKTDQ